MKFRFLLFLVLSAITSFSQNMLLSGKITDASTGETLPFVSIHPKRGAGTLSDFNGEFTISVWAGDSLEFKLLGYKSKYIQVPKTPTSLVIKMEQQKFHLNEVVVTAKDNSWMYALISEAVDHLKDQHQHSKAYFQLSSFIDSTQIELLETFYNLKSNGRDVEELDLKTGRIAMRKYKNRLFASLESSRAIGLYHTTEETDYFPHSPLEYSKRKMKNRFGLEVVNKTIDEFGDSVLVFHYFPIKEPKKFFEGQIWIAKKKKQILKIEMNCLQTGQHPFLPLFPTDQINSVDLHLSKNFEYHGDTTFLRQFDFNYTIHYTNYRITGTKENFDVFTQAILYVYDDQATFELPYFKFPVVNIGDYRKINAIPYNSFFWNENDEFRILGSREKQDEFFYHPQSITNTILFGPNSFFDQGLFQFPYLQWSNKRLTFRSAAPDTLSKTDLNGVILPYSFELKTKLFADINYYHDSLHILTASIWDPFESYFLLPKPKSAVCFINMYFDLCEIERRHLDKKLKSRGITIEEARRYILEAQERLRETQDTFTNESKIGENIAAMKKWNELIKNELQIDNLELFQPYSSKE